MDTRSYYDIAKSDKQYLDALIAVIDKLPGYNPVVVQEEQVVEKMFKHLIDRFIDCDNSVNLLKSHKLANLANAIRPFYTIPVDIGDLRMLSDYYFDGRYPSADYVFASKQDALDGYDVACKICSWVDTIVSRVDMETYADKTGISYEDLYAKVCAVTPELLKLSCRTEEEATLLNWQKYKEVNDIG